MHSLKQKLSGIFSGKKKRRAVILAAVLLLLCAAAFGAQKVYARNFSSAYRVYLGEEYLCAVREQEDLSSACSSFLSELRCPSVSQKYGNDPCRVEEAYVRDSELVSRDEAKELLIAHYADSIEFGCGIIIDGKLFGAVSDPSVVTQALSDLVSDTALAFGGGEGEICEDIETVMGYYSRSVFIPDGELLGRLEGDSLPVPPVQALSAPALTTEGGEKMHDPEDDSGEDGEEDTGTAEIPEENGDAADSSELSLQESEALFASAPVHATVTREEEYTRAVPYEEETVSLEGYYSDYWYTEQEGEDGEETVRDRVTYLCGREVGRENVSVTVTKEPVPGITAVGATERPDGYEAGVQSGTFDWPAPTLWTITSYWGDGRGHKGLDISGSGAWGEPIVASDAGYVSDVSYGWSGGYGNCVDIDHGNGYVTRYAHCSDLCVEIGEPVAKGEIIAYVGSTGDSSGAHLHFEIIRWGEKRDPYPYLFEGICIDRCY